MASGFNDISLKPSGKTTIKLPKKFGASKAKGAVVELKDRLNVAVGPLVRPEALSALGK